ncbi:MAG: GrpB family protein [Terriglobales bacterium]
MRPINSKEMRPRALRCGPQQFHFMTDAPIHIVAYDPSWPDRFEAEKAVLSRVLAPWLDGSIEHVGSTSVVGLCAKPVIDIMVGVRSLAVSAPAKEVLSTIGYHDADYKTDVMHWFCKPSPAIRTHHLHLIPHRSPLWNDRLAFRDLLRSDRSVSREYAALKAIPFNRHFKKSSLQP